MNKRIRSLIDEIFSDMKMTAENLALRDELMANAMDRYEDAVREGMDPEKAFAEVAESLGDVQALICEMNAAGAAPQQAQEEETAVPELTVDGDPALDPTPETETETPEENEKDLGGALNKAFSALGEFSQAIMPEAKKLAHQVDDVTGGVLGTFGKAARKGLRGAKKVAGKTIDKLSGDKGEIVFDFGPKDEAPQAEEESVWESVMEEESGEEAQEGARDEMSAAQLREAAKTLRAEAELKDLSGDQEGARDMRAEAYAMETQAEAIEQAEAMEAARIAAQQEEGAQAEASGGMEEPDAEPAEPAADAPKAPQEPLPLKEENKPLLNEEGEINEDVFTQVVDEMTREAEETIRLANETQDAEADEQEAAAQEPAEPVVGRKLLPAAGLHAVSIKLDADDVSVEAADGNEIEMLWEARSVDGEPVVTMEGHTLTIRRKNPDVFKTFFSVIQKEGGKVTVRVPRGYAAGYQVTTTSGHVQIAQIDADDIKVTTTSGRVRVEPDVAARAGSISVTTVSGHATVSACADEVEVTTVSGNQFISCDAHKVDVNVVSGRVHAEGACDEWDVSAVSSDVELVCTVAPTKRVNLSSMYGTVRLALPAKIRGFAVESSGMLGCEIVNEFGPNRYGTCALPIRMGTMRGKLMITKR